MGKKIKEIKRSERKKLGIEGRSYQVESKYKHPRGSWHGEAEHTVRAGGAAFTVLCS